MSRGGARARGQWTLGKRSCGVAGGCRGLAPASGPPQARNFLICVFSMLRVYVVKQSSTGFGRIHQDSALEGLLRRCAGFGRVRRSSADGAQGAQSAQGAQDSAGRARVAVLYYPQCRAPQHASASLKSHRNFKFSFWNYMSTFTLWAMQNSDARARARTVRLTRFG